MEIHVCNILRRATAMGLPPPHLFVSFVDGTCVKGIEVEYSPSSTAFTPTLMVEGEREEDRAKTKPANRNNSTEHQLITVRWGVESG
jgi:hypothetical protein